MYSKTVLIGRVGKDPKTTKSSTGTTATRFSVATDSGWGDKRQTTWHNIETYGKLAENCPKFVKKGGVVLVEGRIRNSIYEKDGQKVNYSAVVADQITPLSKEESEKKTEAPQSSEPDFDIPFSL